MANLLTKFLLLLPASCLFLSLASCSFDYGDLEHSENVMPNLVMENVEYVRVRSAEPVARFNADYAERWEKQNLMLLENISFEQFGESIEEVNATGTAGNAVIETDSGNILLENGVRIEVESEDITIETEMLQWVDGPKTLSAGEENEVIVSMKSGTNFTGVGFSADVRRRVWEIKQDVHGKYVFEDEDEEEIETSEGENE